LYGALRRNARGLDLSDSDQQRAILLAIQASEQRQVIAEPMLGSDGPPNAFDGDQMAQFITNPADASDRIGWVRATSPTEPPNGRPPGPTSVRPCLNTPRI
ncbi:MAG: hypothetical protein EBT08_20610, partial [Betaproteobacteria bacterium]|nr:hypothetical protein [Betaproteobacteria bacterium]